MNEGPKFSTPDERMMEMESFTPQKQQDNNDQEETQRLVGKPTPSSTSFTLDPVAKSVDFLRRRWLFIVLALLVATVIDVALFYKQIRAPKVDKVEISFDATTAHVAVQGELSKASYTTSFDVSSVHCAYAYRPDDTAPYRAGGRIDVVFPPAGNTEKHFNLDAQLRETRFEVLRRVYWDVSSAAEIHSALKLHCSLSLHASVYSVLPLQYTYRFSQELPLSVLKKAAQDSLTQEDTQALSLPSLSLENKKLTTSEVVYSLVFELTKKPHIVLGRSEVQSFIVNLPSIAYSTALVNKHDEKKNFLVLRTEAVSFDLAQYKVPIAIDVSVGCTPVGRTLDAALASNASCSLLGPLNFGEFKTELANNKFVNMTAQATENHFLTSLLGDTHYIRSVSDDEAKQKVPGFQTGTELMKNGLPDARSTAAASPAAARALTTSAGSDPTISSGADCVTVDSDGVYYSSACTVVEAGFFKLFVGIYDDAGFTGYLNSTTSWAPSMTDVAFESALDASIISSGTPYGVSAELFFSENTQTLNAMASYSEADTVAFIETLTAAWDFANAYSTGSVVATSVTEMDGYAPITTTASLNYGDDRFDASLLMADSEEQQLGDALTVNATGIYGGDLHNWYFAVQNSTLVYDESVVGHATGGIASSVPANGESGSLMLVFDVVDSYDITVTSTDSFLTWFSLNNDWLTNGNLAAYSQFVLLDGGSMIMSWNGTANALYSNGAYSVAVVNNPMPSSQFTSRALSVVEGVAPMLVSRKTPLVRLASIQATASSVPFSADNSTANYFQAVAEGTYDGSINDWLVQLNDGFLVYDHEVVGSAQGSIAAIVPSTGEFGKITVHTKGFDSAHEDAFLTNGSYQWSTPSSWSSAGLVVLSSEGIVYGTSVNWHCASTFRYEDNHYNLIATEQDYGQQVGYNMLLKGEGTYGGSDWNQWFATLDSSSLYSSDVLEGTAVGGLRVNIASTGRAGAVYYNSHVKDSDYGTVLLANKELLWSCENAGSSAQLSVLSQFNLPHYAVDWDASALFKYGNNAYSMTVKETPYDASRIVNFAVHGNGGYGGDWTNWWMTVDDSFLTVSNSLVGHAYFRTALQASDSTFINTNITSAISFADADNEPALLVEHTVRWYSSADNWQESGAMSYEAMWNAPNTTEFTLSGSLSYANDAFDFALKQATCEGETPGCTSTWMDIVGNGVYGGSPATWHATLVEAVLHTNDGLLGSMSAQIDGETRSSWLSGHVVYSTHVRDANGTVAFDSQGSTIWFSPSQDWLTDGSISVLSLMDFINDTAYNSSLSFSYDDSTYSLKVQEKTLNPFDGLEIGGMYAMVTGEFELDSLEQWFVSVTDSLVTVDSEVYMNSRLFLQSNMSSDFMLGTIKASIADYAPLSNVPPLHSSEYPQESSQLWSQNEVSWAAHTSIYGDLEKTFGSLLTNSSYKSRPQFALSSQFWLDLVDEEAYFAVKDTLYGENGLDMWAYAEYDMSTGMIAQMGGELYYEDELLMGMNTNLDMQMDTAYNTSPTMTPTEAPSEAPTEEPTQAPSEGTTQEPTLAPTEVPTPAPSQAPTLAPSQATQVPTQVPTQGPTQATQVPTQTPTQAPTQATQVPTQTPTQAPSQVTQVPTHTPTQAPTQRATEAPSQGPTQAPTRVPTQKPTQVPTQTPTVVPTIVPTDAPSHMPTPFPTAAAPVPVSFAASQTLAGVSLETYNANLEANNNALKSSIAMCMVGVTSNDVQNLMVTASPARRLSHHQGRHLESSSVLATYTINTVSTYSYAALADQLATSVANQQFDTYLHQESEAYGATDLSTVTSAEVSTTYIAPANPSSSSSALSSGAIAGIVIGLVAFAALFMAAVYWWVMQSRAEEQKPLTKMKEAEIEMDIQI